MKILAILPSIPFYGKERSNIEVYKILSESESVDLKIVINKKANRTMREYLKSFSTIQMDFPSRVKRRFRVIRYAGQLIYSNILFLWYLYRFRPDYVFINTESIFYDFILPLFVLRKNKIIYRIGDEPAFPSLVGYKINSFIWKHLICKRVFKFVCISQYIKKQIERNGRLSPEDMVIYNVPPSRISSMSAEKKENLICLSSKSEILKIGYIGQITEQKGVRLLFDVAKRLICENENVEFFFAGSLKYDIRFSESMLKERDHFKYKNRILFLDEIDNIKTFFDSIDILCIPSLRQEPLGNVLVEAKLYQTPCVIFPSGGMPELISHKENGYICKEMSVSTLKEGIKYYLHNKNLILDHGRKNFQSIYSLGIDYDSFKQKWYNVFGLQ